MISLREIARQSNVSLSTVSRALRDDPAVSAKTRQRIQEVALKLNYTPNRLVEGVFKGRTRLIALVTSAAHADPLARKTSRILDEIYSRGWGCLVYNTHNCPEREAECLRQAVGMRVSGIVISTVDYKADETSYRDLRKHGIPFVFTSEHAPTVTVPHIHADDRNLGRQMVEHLCDLGHQRIAHIAGAPETLDNSLRYQGFLDAMKMRKRTIVPEWVIPSADWSEESGLDSMRKLLSLPNRPTAVFAANDILAIGAYQAIVEKGLHIPGDISVAGMGNSNLSRYISPSLTTVRQFQDMVGVKAVEILFKLLEMEDPTVISRSMLDTVIPGEIVVRESTGPCKE